MSTSIPDIAGIATMARHILSSNIGLHLPFIRYSVYSSDMGSAGNWAPVVHERLFSRTRFPLDLRLPVFML